MSNAINILSRRSVERYNLQIKQYRGIVIGAACGDALGMPTELMPRPQIIKLYGGRVDRFYPKSDGKLKAGQWTDDTLLTLATIDSLIEKQGLSPVDIASKIAYAFKNEQVRGFGQATISAATRLLRGHKWNDCGFNGELAAGNGAAMRIYPIALFSYADFDQLKRNCELVAAITHNNQEAINGSLAVAYIIARIINATFDKNNILKDVISFIGKSKMQEKLNDVSIVLNDSSISFEEALELLGTRGSVFETVGSSVYIFLKFLDSFKEALVHSVSYGGDADTIGTIVGAISGAYHGIEAIPQEWVNGVEKSEELLKKAEQLYKVSHGIQI
ncbi:MAG: ADP-ribosylglycohydrolase [Candidatus Saganbacteria bacterium]|uniref:ADP-ribosylglycohydrolase n=1 Tax=Candidatus Saganbacteria bacterium TaxID=2575572 RepID=A0A833L0Z6_UNCSA|nr:MAG: ADP-ribosylglycohydrolase [Candidatus Saganbacteria bacterium]